MINKENEEEKLEILSRYFERLLSTIVSSCKGNYLNNVHKIPLGITELRKFMDNILSVNRSNVQVDSMCASRASCK
jgi:hypothetical protein